MRLSRYFLAETICSLTCKCNYGFFLHFKHFTLFTAWVFYGFVVRNCKIFVQISALFRKISPPLKHLSTLNSRNILIFESSWLSILAIFRLKVAEKLVTFLKFSSVDIFFNVLKFNFIIGVNLKWLEDLERYLHFSAKGWAFSKRQDFTGV